MPTLTDASFRIAFLGDSKVGKSSIINRYCLNTYEAEHHPTIDHHIKPCIKILPYVRDGVQYTIQIELCMYDYASRVGYDRLTGPDEPHCVVLVFDASDMKSLEYIRNWYQGFGSTSTKPVIFVVCNKIDLHTMNSEMSAEAIIKEITRCVFVEVSAKYNVGIQDLFSKIAHRLVEMHPEVIDRYHNNNQYNHGCVCNIL